ncbi:DUF4974 domain-containing protein [Flammeovirgaceae bacterium SG7u.132]|nr:DUF4974 domain-containing protein [Flammeovirgaceae bacterium SG7u.132]
MSKYNSIEDLVSDESFQAYVHDEEDRDVAFWESWLESHPQKQVMFMQAKEMVVLLSLKVSPEELTAEKERLVTSIKTYPQKEHEPKRRWLLSKGFGLSGVAAAVLLAVMALIGYKSSIFGPNREESKPLVAEVKMIEKSSPRGVKSTINLMDGTRIKMNSETTIRFPEVFGDSIREVYLEGEAFFEVARNTNKPFIVHAGDVQTRVLGTSFNISSYPENVATKVALVEGKVEVGHRGLDMALLEPSELYSYNKEKEVGIKRPFEARKELAWRSGTIFFNNADFEQISFTLSRWYDVEFEVLNEPAIVGFKGQFTHQSLESVLKGISFSTKFNFEIKGKKVIIK